MGHTVKTQIVVQDVVEGIVIQIPEVQTGTNTTGTCYFGWGNEDEINRYIISTKGTNYPLVWMLPTTTDINLMTNRVTCDISLIVAVVNDYDDHMNNYRLDTTFKKTLFPIRDYLMFMFRNSGKTKIIDREVVTREFPRYVGKDDNKVVSNWDAIRIDFRAEFNNKSCLKQFDFGG